jgi:hypothetical protein
MYLTGNQSVPAKDFVDAGRPTLEEWVLKAASRKRNSHRQYQN